MLIQNDIVWDGGKISLVDDINWKHTGQRDDIATLTLKPAGYLAVPRRDDGYS